MQQNASEALEQTLQEAEMGEEAIQQQQQIMDTEEPTEQQLPPPPPEEPMLLESYIRYITDPTTGEPVGRQGKLLALMGLRWDGELDYVGVTRFAAAYLAAHHFNERSGAVLPELPDLLKDCDFRWTFEARDTDYDRFIGVQSLVSATIAEPTTTDVGKDDIWQHPFAMAGGMESAVSYALATLGAVWDMPQISSSNNNPLLEDRPLYARTNPTTEIISDAIMTYYKEGLGVDHVAFLAERTLTSHQIMKRLNQAASERNMTLRTFTYHLTDLDVVLQQLAASKMIHIVFYMASTFRDVFLQAYNLGIMGNRHTKHTWLVLQQDDWQRPEFQLSRDDPLDRNLAQALNGIGSVWPSIEPNQGFTKAMNDFANNETMERAFLDSFIANPPILQGVTFPRPLPSTFRSYTPMMYDAVMALGLASCQTPGLFHGYELYETMINGEFQGVSGVVSFDPKTGNRKAEGIKYEIQNAYLSDALSDDTHVRLDHNVTHVVTNGTVQQLLPYIYTDNSTIPPPGLPPVSDHNYNLVPLGAVVFGLILAGLIMTLSIAILIWIYVKRNTTVVRVSQPFFLSLFCIGTIIMTCAVVPMSFQGIERTPGLDAACMITPWLVVLGFVMSFAALFSKTWRLNKLMNSGMSMKRITVTPKDVMLPFAVLMVVNVALLLGWTLVSPWQYHRVEEKHFDEYGRTLASYGVCQSSDNKYLYFLLPLLFCDFFGVSMAAFQCYKARNLPTSMSESLHVAISVGSLLETFLMGGPILLVIRDNPTANYLVSSSLVCIASLTILLPIFLPKFLHRDGTQAAGGRPGNVVSYRSVSSRSVHSHHGGLDNINHSNCLPTRGSGHHSAEAVSSYASNGMNVFEHASIPGMMAITRRGAEEDKRTSLY